MLVGCPSSLQGSFSSPLWWPGSYCSWEEVVVHKHYLYGVAAFPEQPTLPAGSDGVLLAAS